ncbi:MAG: C45 family autoproteolytic acyltransferase/hydrolase [Promethearchaeati archaeon]
MERSIEIFHLEGQDYEMGLKQGRYFQSQIKELYQKLTSSDEFLASKPFFIPKFLYKKLATKISSSMIKASIKEHFPSQWKFLQGLSEGAEISESKLLFLQAIDALGTQVSNYRIEKNVSASFNDCSAVGVKSMKTDTGGVLMIKNWDGPEFLAQYTIFRKMKPSNGKGFATIGSGVVGLEGINNGMNEKGLSIVYNYAYPKEIGDNGVPAMILIKEALENCVSVKETIELFKKYPRIGGANVMVADNDGDLAVIEFSPSNIEVRRRGIERENSFLICTNHYLTPIMKGLEISRDAVYNEDAAEAFKGKPVHKSSIMRYKNAHTILKNNAPEKISLDFLNTQIQSNHGPDNIPSEFTFCNHGTEISTGFGVMLDVKNRHFYATLGNPCEGKMEKLS